MYALLALGFTLVYGILELINFAHFNVFMVGSFIGMWALQLLGLSGQSHDPDRLRAGRRAGLRLCRDDAGCRHLGVAIERMALRPMRGVRGTAAMITTIGVSYILFNIILLTVGAALENFPNPMPAVRWRSPARCCELREVLIWGIAAGADAGRCTSSSTAPGSARRCGRPRRMPRRRA